ncbi:MAG: IS21 family transposase [Sporichthyaceae bacterium]|nr:IS21 family transposase [Sporichthyaceae bacterium]
MLSARKQLDVINAYREVGTYRGAAEMCGVTHKTVKRLVERDRAAAERLARRKNYESVRTLVATKVEATRGKISAKRLLPDATAAGYAGSDRNFRRLVAQEKSKYRQRQAMAGSRRPAVWTPGEHLVIDWGVLNGLHVFCAVLAFSRVRFVRFALDERADTTLQLLAECFQALGGVPKVVLADRMGCLKGGVVADVVIPTPDYVRFATHYRFRPDFCHARDPESKGIVENLVGYAKRDLMIPLGLGEQITDLDAANAAAAAWCEEVNAARHGEIAAVPAQRLADVEGPLLAALPSLLPSGLFGGRRELRKVDKLSCVRFGSARYSVPNRMLGNAVEVVANSSGVTILMPDTGEVLAEHPLMAPGETSVLDEHYDRPRPNTPARKVTPRTAAEHAFCALGPVAEQWLRHAAAAGNTRLGPELNELAALEAAHGHRALIAALERAVTFGRWNASGVRSILAAGAGVAQTTEPGDALVIELPATVTRPLAAYRLSELTDDLPGGA